MINALKGLLGGFQKPRLDVAVSVDHVELADTYLIIGLNLCWHNLTSEPIAVKEVRVKLIPNGRNQEPIKFYAQGHFARIPFQSAIKKKVGAKGFKLPAGETRTEGTRFFTRAILDITPGTYLAEVQAIVAEGAFSNEVIVEITNRMKYRTSEAWMVEDTELSFA